MLIIRLKYIFPCLRRRLISNLKCTYLSPLIPHTIIPQINNNQEIPPHNSSCKCPHVLTMFNFIHNNRAEYCGCEPVHHSEHRCFFFFFTMLSPNFSIRLPKIQAQYILTKRPMLPPTNWARKGVISHPTNITPSKQYICMLNDLNAIRIILCSFIFLISPIFRTSSFQIYLF
ncbi:hypothetical protein B4087_0940 [Bacillus cereus]|nr:hypothetical protein B4087_0940 [Bacillus cereus]